MNQLTIIAIIIAFFPNERTITRAIKSITKQVNKLLIIDNTPNGCNVFKNHELLNMKNNIVLIAGL